MSESLADRFAELPGYLGGHLLLSISALLVGLAISLPLGIWVSRGTKRAELALGVAGVIQTIPSLALLALMVPLLGGMIGFVPAFIALTLYSILPALSGTITGMRGVDPGLIEAARGLGMNDRQVLWRVQLPLALPVIISGIRTATVLVVGTATLVTPVGGRGLGNYIFQGLETRDHVSTVFGCVVAALVAVAMDQLIRLLELAARHRSRIKAWTGAVGLLLFLGAGLYYPLSLLWLPRANLVTIGSGPFTEQYILSEVLANELRGTGFAVDQHKAMGETIQFEALCHSQIDCCVDYAGNIWALVMKRTEFLDGPAMVQEITRYLAERHGVVCLGSLGFENKYALAMSDRLAGARGISTIEDLKKHPDLQREIAGDMQIFTRPEWRELTKRYQLKFAKQSPMEPSLMYGAVGKGPLQVICAYSSDGRVPAMHLRLLRDPEQVFPPYDAILLLSPKAAQKPGLKAALEPLTRAGGALDLATMQEANRLVDVDKQRVSHAAAHIKDELRRHISKGS